MCRELFSLSFTLGCVSGQRPGDFKMLYHLDLTALKLIKLPISKKKETEGFTFACSCIKSSFFVVVLAVHASVQVPDLLIDLLL